MKKTTVFYTIALVVVLAAAIIAGWQYAAARQEIADLEKQVTADTQPGSILDQNSQIDPPSGDADTASWSTFEDEQRRFSLQYPDNWEVYQSQGTVLALKRIPAEQRDDTDVLMSLSIMESTNLNGPSWQREITLAGGEQANYYFDDGFDHYIIKDDDSALTFSVPVRSCDGLYTEQELEQAIQIVNTFQRLD